MSEKELFRKVSLERLSSPEELDQQLTVTSSVGWLALCAVAFLLAAALVWGVFGSIADKTSGEGIIISSGGITNIVHHTGGQITGVSVKDGDLVAKGAVIMRVSQEQTVEEINELKADLEILSGLNTENPLVDTSKLSYRTYDLAMNAAAAKLEIEKAELGLAYAVDKYKKYETLEDAGAISLQEFAAEEENYRRLLLELSIIEEAWQQQIHKIELKIAELGEEIGKRQDRLWKDSEIISPFDGRILEVGVKVGDVIAAGQSVGTVVRRMEQTESLEAVVYVPVEKGKLIMPGMDVNISPTTVKKEEHGFMRGKVVSVSEYPASAEGMRLTLGNPELAQRLMGNSAPLEVKVNLINDNSTLSGYKWSTPQGPPLKIDSGTLCVGEVKVSTTRPISMVVPFLKKILPF
ncbi:MAG: NHLP bacteriocin system secretion protein [Clostridia bacterium]|jgi:HlyD family secretion protein|nr:NHLP bacteriocin system secretion protein [Clostridia bacterium]